MAGKKKKNNPEKEEYFIEVNEVNQKNEPYTCPIKLACYRRFLSAEENWEAIYDLMIVFQNLSKNDLKVLKDEKGKVIDVFWNPIELNDEIISFAFKNVWKYAQMKYETELSENVIIRNRRLDLEQYIIDRLGDQ